MNKEGERLIGEKGWKKKNNLHIFVDCISQPFHNCHGLPLDFLTLIRDVTYCRRFEFQILKNKCHNFSCLPHDFPLIKYF